MIEEQEHIVIIDDDADSAISLARALKAFNKSLSIQVATNANQGELLIEQFSPKVVVLDLCLDEVVGPQSGFDLLSKVLKRDPSCRIIVLTGYGSVELGVRSLQLGAASFLEKPPAIEHLSALIIDGLKLSQLRRSYATLVKSPSDNLVKEVIGNSQAMDEVREALRFAAKTKQPVLLSGETGTGKGLCARAIHTNSDRSSKNFVHYQPSYASGDLIRSELFGHSKGSFTGAIADRKGLLSDADGGTLFLDEIDQLPAETQVSLLGVLQERRFRRLGTNEEISIDCRLITATNADLERCMEEGKLRQDFFHRIAHFRIHLPALRDRKSDIEPLCNRFLEIFRKDASLNVFEVSSDALHSLLSHDWPGNVRELYGTIEGAAYRAQFANRSCINPEDLSFVRNNSNGDLRSFHAQVESFKSKLIQEALERHSGNQVAAAKELQIDRSSLRRVIARS